MAKLAENWSGKFVPGRSRSGVVANKEWLALHPGDYAPWDALKSVIDTWLNAGQKVYMINGAGRPPGGWVATKIYTSLEEARKDLAILNEFTADKGNLVLQEYVVKAPTPIRSGTAGPLTSRTNPSEHYPGGGQQSQLLINGQNGNWMNYLDLVREIPLP